MNISSVDRDIALNRGEKDLEAKNAIWLKAIAVYKDALDRHKEEIYKLKRNISDAQDDYEHACEAYDNLLEET